MNISAAIMTRRAPPTLAAHRVIVGLVVRPVPSQVDWH